MMNRKFQILLALVLVIILNGCVSSRHRKGSLSDVFNEEDSSDDYYEDDDDDSDFFFFFDNDDDDDNYYEDEDEDSDYYDENEILVDLDDSHASTYSGISLGYRHIPYNNLKSAINLSYIIGGFNNHEDEYSNWGAFLKAGLIWTENKPSKPNYETENDSLFGATAGFEIRRSLTDRNEPFYIDALADVEVGYSFWEYTEPKTYDGSDYYMDGLPSFTIGAGFSFCYWNNKNWGLFIDPTVGASAFGDYSFQGFSNDVFQPYIYAQLMFKLVNIETPKDDN